MAFSGLEYSLDIYCSVIVWCLWFAVHVSVVYSVYHFVIWFRFSYSRHNCIQCLLRFLVSVVGYATSQLHMCLLLCDDVLIFFIFCVSTFVYNTIDMANIWFETSVLLVLNFSCEITITIFIWYVF